MVTAPQWSIPPAKVCRASGISAVAVRKKVRATIPKALLKDGNPDDQLRHDTLLGVGFTHDEEDGRIKGARAELIGRGTSHEVGEWRQSGHARVKKSAGRNPR